MIFFTQKSSKIRLKYLFRERITGSWGDEPYEGNSIICIRAADFEMDKLSHKTEGLTRRSFKEEEIYKKSLKKGDLIIEKSGGGENQPVGRIAVFSLDEVALCSNFLEILRPDFTKVVTDYVAYLLHSFWLNRKILPAIKQTTGIQNLDISEFLDFNVDLPVLSTQQKISAYIKSEIELIDNLISARQKQLLYLSDKKQALITNAVTKGVNSQSAKKDSGVEWIGKIPIAWNVNKIKYLTNLKSGEFITAEDINEVGRYPVYGGNGLRGYTSRKTHTGKFVLIGRQGALCGNINYANGEFWASEHAIVCLPIVEYNTLWFGELLRIMNLNQYSAAAAQPGLSVEVIKNLEIPVPPQEEQVKIAEFIIDNINKINELINKTTNSINLLKEKKDALITVAITGQINPS
jgi:type I restriction enzyme S subunit